MSSTKGKKSSVHWVNVDKCPITGRCAKIVIGKTVTSIFIRHTRRRARDSRTAISTHAFLLSSNAGGEFPNLLEGR
jgi:hypothetical protein